MRVLTYVAGILTVISEKGFYRGMEEKPSFITGENFYYEPTLKQQDGIALSAEQTQEAEAYIEAFNFIKKVPSLPKVVHTVDKYGNYLGLKTPENEEVEVSSEPFASTGYVVWDFEANGWYEATVVNGITGAIVGEMKNEDTQNCFYVRKTLIDPQLCTACQIYNLAQGRFDIDIEIVKKNKLIKLTQDFSVFIKSIIGEAPVSEISSWNVQEKEARAWVLDTEIQTPFIDALLTGRNIEGETKESLINIIITKADNYKAFYGQQLGRLHVKQKLIENATSVEELKFITWES
ncbi:MAG: hypothetical protein PHW07_06545 [Sulfurospirillaceae bacterium]|nr:hypothetical protein [Sulfurospirillaceae bacterium]